MKKLFLTMAALATAAAVSQAQFRLTTFDGKTIANKNQPDVTLQDMNSTLYYTWEADFVRIQWVMRAGSKLAVDETLLYYVDADTALPKLEGIPGSAVGTDLTSVRGATIPHYNWRTDAYYQKMEAKTTVMFANKADGMAFMAKLAQKKKSAPTPIRRIVLKNIVKEKK